MAAITAAAPYAAPRPRPAQSGACARLALCRASGAGRAGAGRRRHRLTDSGLSITEWQPIHGVIPPLNDAEWQEEFAALPADPSVHRAQQGHEHRGVQVDLLVGMGASHPGARRRRRLCACRCCSSGRRGRIESGLAPKLIGILLLGGLQGAIGWWMVASGLVDRVSVSQYRLATHLTLAALIFTATMVVARGLAPHSEPAADRSTQRLAGVHRAAGAGADLSRRAGRRA